MSEVFSAVSSMLGYLYQVNYSLLQALNAEDYKFITIEKFDDISLSNGNGLVKLCQLKHHQSGSLTDSSSDLWKTLRIWCSMINEGTINISETKFVIITTQVAKENSLSYNFTDRCRLANSCLSSETIVDKLKIISKTSTNKENESAYNEFNKTPNENLSKLISNILVIDQSPTIQNVEKLIKNKLKYVCNEKNINAFFERIEGWWFSHIINHLTTENLPPIKISELDNKIDDLREQFYIDNLPIDFIDDIELDISIYSDNIFVEQLKLIKIHQNRLVSAINDFYKASTQRSKWVRESLISFEELGKYEKKLINEWERVFYATIDEYENKISQIACGKKIYHNIELITKVNIRDKCTEPYVMRGSYHILSNGKKVGWHPEFREIVNKVEIEREGA